MPAINVVIESKVSQSNRARQLNDNGAGVGWTIGRRFAEARPRRR